MILAKANFSSNVIIHKIFRGYVFLEDICLQQWSLLECSIHIAYLCSIVVGYSAYIKILWWVEDFCVLVCSCKSPSAPPKKKLNLIELYHLAHMLFHSQKSLGNKITLNTLCSFASFVLLATKKSVVDNIFYSRNMQGSKALGSLFDIKYFGPSFMDPFLKVFFFFCYA